MDAEPLMDTHVPRTLPDDPAHRAWPALSTDPPLVHLIRGDHPDRWNPPRPGDTGRATALCGRYVPPQTPVDDDGHFPPCTSCRREAGRLAISWPCCTDHYR